MEFDKTPQYFRFHVTAVRFPAPGKGAVKKAIVFAMTDTPADPTHAYAVGDFHRIRVESALNWLLANQKKDGSWRTYAKRPFTKDIFLKPGWCSAMGQGLSFCGIFLAYFPTVIIANVFNDCCLQILTCPEMNAWMTT